MGAPVGDLLYLETHDGKDLFVPDAEVRFLVYGNFGAPPVNFITRTGYKMHGAIEVDYLLEPRAITVDLWRAAACSRQQYWDNRLALHEFLRHNRGGPLTFVLREPNGQQRALTVRANPGLQFPMPRSDNNNWSVEESVDFVAFDPVWFNPERNSEYLLAVADLNLVFPIVFPITFGSSGIVSSTTLRYAGTWNSFPTLTLFGPYTIAVLTNVTTGVTIYLYGVVAGGSRRIITLTPGAQSVQDEFGNNCFGELGPASDLVDFNLRPDGEIPGGYQTIQALFIGGTLGTTALQLDFYERFFAL